MPSQNELQPGSSVLSKDAVDRRPWLKSYPEDVASEISVGPDENLNLMFDEVCLSFPENKAYTSFEHSVTYKEAHTMVAHLAAFLQSEFGLKKGDSLALIMPNVIQYPISVFAGLRAGLRIVNINPLYTAREIASVLRDSRAAAVIAFTTVGARLEEIAREMPLPRIIMTGPGDLLGFFRGTAVNLAARYLARAIPPYKLEESLSFHQALFRGVNAPFKHVELKADDIAFLQFTGGTTGKPKGARLSHGNILANVRQCLEMYGHELARGRETLLTPLPLYHVFSMTVNLMLQTALGANSLLIMDARRFKDFLSVVKKHPEISVMTGVNTLFAAMLDHGVFEKIPMPGLRLAIGGGAAVQSGVAARFYKASGQHILEGYGLTECSPVACVNPYTSRIFTGSIGIPLPSTDARIVDTDTGEEIWDLNRPGELEFRGPQVMKGYYRNEAENAKVRDGQWLRTGDIAVWLEDGYLKIIDRIKDMIIVSGFNVYPSEIEDVVSHFDKVLECCAVGVPCEKTGERIKLFVVRRDPALTSDEVHAYCRKNLTGYKQPKEVEFISALPKSPVGKIMRRYLLQNKYS